MSCVWGTVNLRISNDYIELIFTSPIRGENLLTSTTLHNLLYCFHYLVVQYTRMASESLKNLSSTDEDDGSCDEDRSDGRRRRFCIERKQEEEQRKQKTDLDQRQSNSRKSNLSRIRKLPKLNHASNRNTIKNQTGKTSSITKRKFSNYSNNTHPNSKAFPTITSNKLNMAKDSSKSPVIFINPSFVRRFLEKSLKLASLNAANNTARNFTQTKSLLDNTDLVSNSSNRTSCSTSDLVPTSSSSSTSMIEDLDFKTKPRESLKAASTMAIIRLVTECIEDTRKRDEKLNKTLVSQLIDKLVNGERIDPSASEICSADQSHKNSTRSYYIGVEEISQKEDAIEGTSNCGGQPIPVIGGSVNQYFNKTNINRAYYSPQHRNPYQRPKRTGNGRNDRNEMQNKIKNLSMQ